MPAGEEQSVKVPLCILSAGIFFKGAGFVSIRYFSKIRFPGLTS